MMMFAHDEDEQDKGEEAEGDEEDMDEEDDFDMGGEFSDDEQQ